MTRHHHVSEYLYQPYVQGVAINSLGPRAIPVKKIWFKKRPVEGFMMTTPSAEPSR